MTTAASNEPRVNISYYKSTSFDEAESKMTEHTGRHYMLIQKTASNKKKEITINWQRVDDGMLNSTNKVAHEAKVALKPFKEIDSSNNTPKASL